MKVKNRMAAWVQNGCKCIVCLPLWSRGYWSCSSLLLLNIMSVSYHISLLQEKSKFKIWSIVSNEGGSLLHYRKLNHHKLGPSIHWNISVILIFNMQNARNLNVFFKNEPPELEDLMLDWEKRNKNLLTLVHIFGDWIFKLFIQWPQDRVRRVSASLFVSHPIPTTWSCLVELVFSFPFLSSFLMSSPILSSPLSFFPPTSLPFFSPSPSSFLLSFFFYSMSVVAHLCHPHSTSSRIFFIKGSYSYLLRSVIKCLGVVRTHMMKLCFANSLFERIYKSGDEAYSWPRPVHQPHSPSLAPTIALSFVLRIPNLSIFAKGKQTLLYFPSHYYLYKYVFP